MKKQYLLFLFLFTLLSKLFSQTSYDWSQHLDQLSNSYFLNRCQVYDIETDPSGNVYVVGMFRGQVDFNTAASGGDLTSIGGTPSEDPFIAKYSSTGVFQWVRHIINPYNGGTTQESANSLAVDAAGNAYVAGKMGNGGHAVFVARYTPTGTQTYLHQFEGYTISNTEDLLTVDNSGNLYMLGRFELTADLDPGPGVINRTATGDYDIYLIKMTASTGNAQWVKTMGAASGYQTPYSITNDGTYVYITGGFINTVDFNPDAGVNNLTSSGGSSDMFVARYLASTGAYDYAYSFGSTNVDQGYEMALDGTDLYITGRFTGTVDFQPGAGTINLISRDGGVNTSAMFARYNKNTMVASWADTVPNTYGSYVPIAIVGGNVLMTAQNHLLGDYDLGAGVTTVPRGTGNTSPYVAMSYDASKNFLFANNIANFGASGTNYYPSMGSDNNGGFLFGIGMTPDVYLDYTSPATVHHTEGTEGDDAFVAHYNICAGGPSQPSTITGNTNICSSSQTYSVTNVAGVTYAWTYSGGGTPSGTTNSTTFTPTSSGTLSVTASNACGTSAARTLAITVASAAPSQPSVITGSTPICSSSQTYSVTNVAGVTYAWSYSGGGTPSGTTNSTTFTPTSSGTLSVTATNACGTSTPRTLAIVVDASAPAQPSTITGNTDICSSSQTYSVTNVAGVTYAWSYSGGGTPSGTTNSTTFTPTSSGTLSVTASNACGTSAARTLAITVSSVAPSQPSAITGTTPVCSGSSQTYSVTNVAGVTYAWTYSGGGTPSGTTNSTTFTPTSSGTLSVTASNACGTSAARTLALVVDASVPAQPSVITGNDTLCSSGQTYSVTNVAGVTYAWSYSGTGTPSGTTNSTTFTPTSSGTLSVTASNSCGTSAARTLAITVYSGAPATPGAITGTSNFCRGTSQNYSIGAVANATSYTWSYSGTPSVSSTTTSVTFTPLTSGVLSVTATNACGTSAARNLSLTVDTTYPVNIISSGFDMCVGDARTLVGSPVGGTFSVLSGGAFGSVTGNTLNANAVGTVQIRYRITNACGNMDDTQSINIVSTSAATITSPTTAMCIDELRGLIGTPTGGSFSIIGGPGYIGLNDTLTANASGTVQVEYQYISPCGITADTVSIIVNPEPVVTITSASSDMCIGGTRALTGTPGAGTWAVLSGPGSITGSTLTATGAGTIQIEYTASALGCPGSTTQTINVLGTSDATWTNPGNICESAGLVDLTTYLPGTSTPGGVWSGNPNVSAGGILNTAGLGGTTINIKYKVGPTPCADSLTQSVTITTAPNASWTMPNPICETQQYDLDTLLSVGATTGGTWSILSGGGTLVGSVYTPANVASNTSASIRYSIAASGGCSAINQDESFTVNVQEVAINSTSTADICESSTKALTGTPSGGTWSVVSGGGSITGTTYTPANVTTNTTVVIRYYAPDNGVCLGDSADVSFTVNSDTIVSNTTSSNSICSSETKMLSGTPLGGVWSVISGGGTIAGTTYTPASVVTTTNVTVRYEYINGACANMQDVTFSVNPTAPQPVISSLPTGADTICSGGTVTLNATISGVGNTIAWYTNNNPQPNTQSGIPVGYGTSIAVSPSVNTTYYAFGTTSQSCNSTSYDSINIFIHSPSTPAASISATLDTICSGQSTTLTLAGGSIGKNAVWTWYEVSCGAGTSIGTGTSVTVSPTADESYYVRAEGLCDTTACTQFDVIVQNSVDATWTAPDSICLDAGLIDLSLYLAGTSTSGGTWTGTGVTDSTFDPQVNGLGTVTITYTVGVSPCIDMMSQTITVYQSSSANISDDYFTITTGSTEILDVESNDATQGVVSVTVLAQVGVAYVNNNRIVYIADSSYRGYDTIEYSVCDNSCSNTCDTAQVVIRLEKNVFDNPDNGNIGLWGVSPNQDGVNDVLYIDDLYNHPNNKITIYNRWGDEIYTVSPYTNDWDGDTFVKGHYFFVLEFLDSNEVFKGIIYLKK